MELTDINLIDLYMNACAVKDELCQQIALTKLSKILNNEELLELMKQGEKL